MPARDSGKIGQFMQCVREFRTREGRIPSVAETKQFGTYDYLTRAEGLRRVSQEFGEPEPYRQRRKKQAVLRERAREFIQTHYQQHGTLPTAAETATAVNSSRATAQNTLSLFRNQMGIQSNAMARRVMKLAKTTTKSNERQAEILKVYNALVAQHPNASANALMVATGAILGITRQRVHQVLVF